MARAAPAVVHVHSLVLARCCSHPLGPVCSRLAYASPRPAADAASAAAVVAAAPQPFLPLPPLAPRVSAPPSMLVLLLLLQLQLCGCISCCRRCRCVSRCHHCCIVSRCRRYHCAYVRLSSVCDPLSVKSIISILTMIR